ncbi:sugar transferase, PEP-CTERM/EpsH1 system associated [compost metagenome]
MEQAGVKVVGWVPKNDVWEHLNNARLYLSTARWEGMPVSLIEASFAGLPVIASSCAGNIDVVEHGKTGWVFRTTDEAVQHVFSALEDSQKASEKARMAFEIAQRRFNVERYLNDFENLN